jgi:L-alanine-DL-glutamate epimerase-like enolase superfamily enzyme
MRITSLKLVPIYSTREMGKSCPSDPEKSVSEHVIVFLHTDAGITGLGEMSDVGFALSPAALGALTSRLESVLLHRNLFELTAIQSALREHQWDHQVLCGIDIALHDAISRGLDIPLHVLLGGKVRDRIPFAYPLAPCGVEADVAANLERVERLQGQGHPTIRYYFGLDLTLDERFLTDLRKRWGDRVQINALDASGRFDVETAIEVIHRFAPFHPNLVESPIAGRHNAPAEDFRAVKDAVDIPIGEHITDAVVAARLHEVVDVFNLGVGNEGITACRQMFGFAQFLGVKALAGSTVEMSIGTAARAHTIAAVPNIDFPCYPSGPLVFDEQIVVEQVVYEAGHIVVPDGPGLGVEIDADRLAKQRLW